LVSQRLYDLVFLVVPEKDEAETAAIVEEFRKLLLEQGATLEKDESMGRRRLAYTIKKRNDATYHNFLFRAESKGVAEVQRKMRLSESILRFLTVRVDEEMKHGQKVARNTKVRTPRPVPSMDGPMGYNPAPYSAAPQAFVPQAAAPAPVVAPAPEAEPEAGKGGE
jgi:small subunit ribosomal protein S6